MEIENPLNIREMEFNILLSLDYDDIISFSITSKFNKDIINDKYFWTIKAQHDFNVSRGYFENTYFPPNLRYLQIATYHKKFGSSAYLFMKADKFIKKAIKYKKDYLINLIIDKTSIHPNTIIEEYIKRDDIVNVKKWIPNASNLEFKYIKSIEMLNLLKSYYPDINFLIDYKYI